MTVIAFRFALGVALGCVGSHAFAGDEAHWSYAGAEGPEKWGEIRPEFATCKLGREQSPIDIRDQDAQKANLDAIKFDYKPVPLKIVDNGHTIQVNYAPGSSITVNGVRYELQQFHFHKPSEEKINGKAYPMVAHLVHRNKQGKLAVVAVFMDSGKGHPTLKTLWTNLPKEKEKEVALENVSIDAATLLPGDRSYYTFNGSLTTPPCSEGVSWFVLKQPVQASKEEIEAFAKLYSMNARPVQPLNGRAIRTSN